MNLATGWGKILINFTILADMSAYQSCLLLDTLALVV